MIARTGAQAEARATATILHGAETSLFDGEDSEGARRRIRFGRVDVQNAVAAQLLGAIERFVGGLDEAGEAAFGVGLRRRGADADGEDSVGVGVRMRNIERHACRGESARVMPSDRCPTARRARARIPRRRSARRNRTAVWRRAR